jgi:peptide/nickel transport system substrate-binding protein
MDPARRSALIHDAFRRVREMVYTIPLHRQVIPWAVRSGVQAMHRADNQLEAAWVRIP